MGFIVSSISVTSCGALEALGKGIESLIISLLRYVIIIIPIAYILSRVYGATGMWNTFWITEIIVSIVAWIIYSNVQKKNKC